MAAGFAVYLLVGLFLVHRWVFTITSMGSGSMAPTLCSDVNAPDRVLVDRLTPLLRAPVRGEIVHFQDEKGEWIMKRVVGLPGERVEIRDLHVLVDGKRLSGPAEVATRSYTNQGHMGPGVVVQVNAGHFFVMGDDTADSYDSRFWGCLPGKDISGLARAVVWPLKHAAALAPTF